MKMLKKLLTQNFQSHKKTELEFHPGVNVIIGSSDSGKSALLRALRFVVQNRPSGNTVRSWWGGETSVSIETEEGTVTRIKDKFEEYRVNATSFKAFKTEVPQEVSDVLRLTDINLQKQLDKPFLLDATPGEVAAHFNKIANLSIIDKVTSNIKSQLSEITQNKRYKEADLEKQETTLKSFDYLDEFEIKVEGLEELQNKLSSIENQKRRLKDSISKIASKTEEIKEASKIIVAEDSVNRLLELIKTKDELISKSKGMQKICINIQHNNDAILNNKRIIKNEQIITNVLEKFATLDVLKKDKKVFSKLVENITSVEEKRINSKLNTEKLEKNYHDNYPDICPFCQSKIKK